MQVQPATHDTFVLTRSYPQAPRRVFAAFADSVQKRRWYASSEHHEVEEFEMDFRIGGAERARYRFKAGTPVAGAAFTHHGVYLDIVTERRIVIGSAMAMEERRFSASLVTIELVPDRQGTKLVCTHHGSYFEGADGPRMREAGWQKHFERLAAALAQE